MRLELKADAEEIANAAEAIRAHVAEQGVAADIAFQLSVCVSEALNNVLEHGYAGEPGGAIEVRCLVTTEAVTLDIIDQAKALAQIPDSTLSDPEAEDGRGWFIIRSWMDQLNHESGPDGNRLRMVKFRADETTGDDM